jgi:succinate dehydrogenase / fumarate reductase cytochrome b subunit
MQFAEISGLQTGPFDPQDGAAYVKALFTTPIWGQVYCVLYMLWFGALWLHLNHGVWSALHTLGWNNQTWMKRIKVIGCVVATLAVLPFTIVVLYYLGVGIGQML